MKDLTLEGFADFVRNEHVLIIKLALESNIPELDLSSRYPYTWHHDWIRSQSKPIDNGEMISRGEVARELKKIGEKYGKEVYEAAGAIGAILYLLSTNTIKVLEIALNMKDRINEMFNLVRDSGMTDDELFYAIGERRKP